VKERKKKTPSRLNLDKRHPSRIFEKQLIPEDTEPLVVNNSKVAEKDASRNRKMIASGLA